MSGIGALPATRPQQTALLQRLSGAKTPL
jgi:hypothetical protein